MSTGTESQVVNKELLERALKSPVEKFQVLPGSSLGDGYSCLLYSVDVWKRGKVEPLHLLIKCFPSNPARQVFLEEGGTFSVELGMYETVIPELVKFQEGSNAERFVKLPFPPFHAGLHIPKDQRNDESNNNPLGNHIVMTDIRKSGGFHLRDRFLGFDLDHYTLVIEAQATLHSLSWAYKCKTGVDLKEKFPCIASNAVVATMEQVIENYFGGQIEVGASIIKDDPALIRGLEHLRKVIIPASKLYYNVPLKENEKIHTIDSILRIPGKTIENEEPWDVILHGDAWSNNMMFRYDEATGRPVEVVLLDFQLTRVGNPFADMSNTLYTSTNEELRHKHLTSMLHLYYDTFEGICKNFCVPTPPGWSWEEFNRRFHRAQIFGISCAVMALPVILKDANVISDMENMNNEENNTKGGDSENSDGMKQMLSELYSATGFNPIMEKRLRGAVADAVRAGVI